MKQRLRAKIINCYLKITNHVPTIRAFYIILQSEQPQEAPRLDTQFQLNTYVLYGAQNEAYRMMEGWKVGEDGGLQRVMRFMAVEAPQNETFTLV